MVRAFDDHLVGADALHHVVDAVAALVQVSFNLEGRETVGNDANPPAGAVGAGPVIPIRQDFVRRVFFVPLAERAGRGLSRQAPFGLEVVRTLGALVRDDHPAADDRVFAELWHARHLLSSSHLRLAT